MTHNEPPATSPAGALTVRDNADAQRYEIAIDGEVAFLAYRRSRNRIALVHTEVPESLRGRGLAPSLARWALESARASGLRVLVFCPFVKTYIRRHPDFADLVVTADDPSADVGS